MTADRALGAAIRSGAGGVHGAAVRAGAAAHRPIRRRCRKLRLRTFDLFQVLRPREQTVAPGRHRRHRRSKPEGDRAMAVAAHGRGRSGHASSRELGARGDRLRHHLSPSPTACRPRSRRKASAASTTRRAPSCDSLPSNDEVLADAIKHARVVVGQAGSATPQPRSRRGEGAANRLRRSTDPIRRRSW